MGPLLIVNFIKVVLLICVFSRELLKALSHLLLRETNEYEITEIRKITSKCALNEKKSP
jgi:hypothetical protein